MSSPNLPAGAEALAPHQRDFLADILASEFYRWCGVEVLEIGGEESSLRFRPRSEMLAPWGTLNGSLLNALLELPSFLALLPKLSAEEGADVNTTSGWLGHPALVVAAKGGHVDTVRMLLPGGVQ